MKYLYIFIIIIQLTKSFKHSLEKDDLNSPEKCNEFCSQIGGACTLDSKCICKYGFSTNFNEENIIFCNYKQYNKIITGLIELFFGFGFGHFYCERVLNGYLQLSIEFTFCYFMSFLMSAFLVADDLFHHGNPYYTNIISNYYVPLFSSFLVLWQIIDSFLFFFCYYKDGNGINLY